MGGRGLAGVAFLSVAVLFHAAAAEKDLGGGWQEKKNNEGKVVQELKIEAPTMTEEDQYGYTMPDRYKCDSCRAVMFHIEKDLSKRHPKSRRMKQWEYTDAFDDICKTSFEGYGIKLINGENALSGPALMDRDNQLAPGSGAIQMGGESWTKRLGEICRKTIYEKVGEEEVYEAFYKQHKAQAADEAEAGAQLSLHEAFCVKELRECETGPKLPPKPKETEEKPAKPEKAKPAKAAKAKKEKENAALKKTAKASSDASEPARTSASSSATKAKEVAGEKVGVEAFLRGLASRHGLASDAYLTPRSAGEWEKLTVGIAGKLFDRFATSDDKSCPGAAVSTQ
jgi:hypothetical protein